MLPITNTHTTGRSRSVPTNIIFAADASVRVIDDPHEVMTKLKQGSVQFEQTGGEGTGPVHLINPALILYLEKVTDSAGASTGTG
jgi:hypothetical protein